MIFTRRVGGGWPAILFAPLCACQVPPLPAGAAADAATDVAPVDAGAEVAAMDAAQDAGPQPVVVVQQPYVESVEDMVTDGTTLVWIDSSAEVTLRQASTTAPPAPILLGTLTVGDHDLALGAPNVYWPRLDGASLEVWTATLGTPGSASLGSSFAPDGGVTGVFGLVFDPNVDKLFALAVTSGHGQLLTCTPPDDCAPAGGWSPMASDSFARQMLYDADHLFWADWSAGAVRGWLQGTNGGNTIDFGTSEANPDFLATDGNYVYWANLAAGGTIRRSSLATPGADTVGTAGAGISGLAAANGVVYYAIPSDGAGGGGIFQIAAPGATPALVVGASQAGTAFPLRIAAGMLYWADAHSKAIYRLAL